MAKNAPKSGTYWLYGRHAVEAALSNPQRRVRRVLCAAKEIPNWLQAVKPERVDAQQIDKRVGRDAVHQGVAAEVDPLDAPHISEIAATKQPVLMLDQVTDPHNIGAILRSAAAFGIAAVMVPKDHAPNESGVMAKAACGALEHVPLVPIGNLAQAIKELKKEDYWILGLDGEARESVDKAKNYQPLALVLGAEGKGMRRLTRELCDLLVKIPIDATMESLNVSNAAAIALYAAKQ